MTAAASDSIQVGFADIPRKSVGKHAVPTSLQGIRVRYPAMRERERERQSGRGPPSWHPAVGMAGGTEEGRKGGNEEDGMSTSLRGGGRNDKNKEQP